MKTVFSTRSVPRAYKRTPEMKKASGSRWGSTPRITMLANASSKLLLACKKARRTPVREFYKTFSILYVYDYIIKLSRQQAEVIQNHENANLRNTGQDEARHRKYKRLKLGGGQAYDHHMTRLPL
jgi:hypothetical protein